MIINTIPPFIMRRILSTVLLACLVLGAWRGDHYVTLVVQVPTKLNEEAKEALRKFDEACGNKPGSEAKGGSEKSEKKKKSFMDKLKETFED